MKILHILIILTFLFIGSPAISSDELTNFNISIENSSLKKKFIQVKDDICSNEPPKECKLAKLVFESAECKNDPKEEKCVAAIEITNGGFCVEGLIFTGWLEENEKVHLEICPNHTGKGKIAIRNSETAPWTHYNWVEPGETISPK